MDVGFSVPLLSNFNGNCYQRTWSRNRWKSEPNVHLQHKLKLMILQSVKNRCYINVNAHPKGVKLSVRTEAWNHSLVRLLTACCTVLRTEDSALRFPELRMQHSSDDWSCSQRNTHWFTTVLVSSRQAVKGKAEIEKAFNLDYGHCCLLKPLVTSTKDKNKNKKCSMWNFIQLLTIQWMTKDSTLSIILTCW